jgi:hypothetical protein
MDFQTPDWVCEYMSALLTGEHMRVLEPTPGEGNLVKSLQRRGHQVVAPNQFYKMSGWFDAVVMNPPFTPMKTGYEILERVMGMSHVVIALMPWLTIINSEQRTHDIKSYGLKSVTHLPRSVFPGSRVQTCVLEMRCGYIGNTLFHIIEGKGN